MQIGSGFWEEFDHIHTYVHTHIHTRNRSQYTRNAQYQTCLAGFDNTIMAWRHLVKTIVVRPISSPRSKNASDRNFAKIEFLIASCCTYKDLSGGGGFDS